MTAVPLIACAPEPSKVTVFAPGEKVPPLFVQLPAALMFVPAVSEPPLSVRFPLISSSAGAVKLPAVIVRSPVVIVVVLPPAANVPPLLLTMKVLNVSLVAVPLMFRAPDPLKLNVPLL